MNLQSNNRQRRKKVGEQYYGARYVQLYKVSVYVTVRGRFLRIQTSLIDKGNQKNTTLSIC